MVQDNSILQMQLNKIDHFEYYLETASETHPRYSSGFFFTRASIKEVAAVTTPMCCNNILLRDLTYVDTNMFIHGRNTVIVQDLCVTYLIIQQVYNTCRPFSSRNNVRFSAEKAKKAKSGTLLYNIQSIPENKSTPIRNVWIFKE